MDQRLSGGDAVANCITGIDQEQRVCPASHGEARHQRNQHSSGEEGEHAREGQGPPSCHVKSVGEGPEGAYSGVNEIRDDQQWSSLMCELGGNYLTAAFSLLPAETLTLLDAAIWIVAPVWGLRP